MRHGLGAAHLRSAHGHLSVLQVAQDVGSGTLELHDPGGHGVRALERTVAARGQFVVDPAHADGAPDRLADVQGKLGPDVLRSVVRHGDSSLSVLGCPESAHPGRYPGCTDTVHTAAYSPCSSWKYSLTVCAMPACVEGWGTVASPASSTRRVPNCSSEPSQSADTSQSHASRGP